MASWSRGKERLRRPEFRLSQRAQLANLRVLIPMKPRQLLALTVVVGTTLLVARAQEPEKLSQQNAIAGTMDIDFKSRKNLDEKGKPQKGAADQYSVALNVA